MKDNEQNPISSPESSQNTNEDSDLTKSGTTDNSSSPSQNDLESLQETQVHQSVSISRSVWSGPLPNPQTLAGYGSIDPSFPDRIIALTENEAGRRYELEREHLRLVGADAAQSRVERGRGQWMGFLSCLVLVVIGSIAAFTDRETVASVIFGSTILGVVTVFVLGKTRKEKRNES